MNVTIYHNPNCGTSRKTLQLIRDNGIDPIVIEYLKTPPNKSQLEQLLSLINRPVREIMRRRGTRYDELQLDDQKWSDNELINLMVADPILINRPLVVSERGAKLCRPADEVLELFDK